MKVLGFLTFGLVLTSLLSPIPVTDACLRLSSDDPPPPSVARPDDVSRFPTTGLTPGGDNGTDNDTDNDTLRPSLSHRYNCTPEETRKAACLHSGVCYVVELHGRVAYCHCVGLEAGARCEQMVYIPSRAGLDQDSLRLVAIIVVVCAASLFAAFAGVMFFFCRRKRRHTYRRQACRCPPCSSWSCYALCREAAYTAPGDPPLDEETKETDPVFSHSAGKEQGKRNHTFQIL